MSRLDQLTVDSGQVTVGEGPAAAEPPVGPDNRQLSTANRQPPPAVEQAKSPESPASAKPSTAPRGPGRPPAADVPRDTEEAALIHRGYYVTPELAFQVADEAARRGTDKSRVVRDALRRYFYNS